MPEKPRFGIDQVREFAQKRVEMTSLREVAADVGMSFSGLFSFLQGGEPYSRNRQKLVDWYIRTRHAAGKAIRPEDVDAAVALLEEYINSGNTTEQAKRRAKEIAARILGDGVR
jgi:hypothetical protein